jgi:PAS domain S-box-containing protein
MVLRNPFRLDRATIGTRLTACFVAIVLSMIAADAIAMWQFSRTSAPARRLTQADQNSLSVARVHLDVDTFRDNLAELASTHDIRQFTTKAAVLREKFGEDIAQARQLLGSSMETRQDAAIPSALETLRVTLPSQLDSAIELASVGDWLALSLRVRDQVQALIQLSSSLVEKVDREISRQRVEAIESGERAAGQLVVIVPVSALLALLIAAGLGWYATRSITHPLSQLRTGAQALAEGDFQQRVAIRGQDELAQLGNVFNDTARRLSALYETLRTNEARLRLTIDTIPAYVWSALPDGSLDFINQRWREFSGLSMEQCLGWGWETAVHPEDRAHFLETWRAAIATGQEMEAEARVRRADGTYRWLLIRNVPLHDETGKIVKWYGKSTDITERKLAEEDLREAESRFRTFVDNATDAFLLLDDQYNVIDVNRQASESLGYTREELIGMKHHEFDPNVDTARSGWIQDQLQAGVVCDFETLHRRKDGTVFPVEVRVRPIWRGGHRLSVCLARDITDRKRAEEERVTQMQRALHMASEARLNERLRVARELHDTLLQSFQGLMFSFQAARNLLPRRTEEAVRTLDAAIREGDEAIAEGRDAIQGLRASSALGSNLEHLLTAAGSELAGSSVGQGDAPDFRVIVEGAPQPLALPLQDEVYQIARELLRNAFHHAQASRIEAGLAYDASFFRLRIRDNGKGLDRKVVASGARQGHWGLPGVGERAKHIGAQLKLLSEPGAGTEAELIVPARIAYGHRPEGSGAVS